MADRKPFNAVAAFAAACTDEQPREHQLGSFKTHYATCLNLPLVLVCKSRPCCDKAVSTVCVGPGEGAVSMQRCWQLLAAVAAEALDMPAGQHGARRAALLQGSRQYLQRGHAAYMQIIIQSHRSEVTRV